MSDERKLQEEKKKKLIIEFDNWSPIRFVFCTDTRLSVADGTCRRFQKFFFFFVKLTKFLIFIKKFPLKKISKKALSIHPPQALPTSNSTLCIKLICVYFKNEKWKYFFWKIIQKNRNKCTQKTRPAATAAVGIGCDGSRHTRHVVDMIR